MESQAGSSARSLGQCPWCPVVLSWESAVRESAIFREISHFLKLTYPKCQLWPHISSFLMSISICLRDGYLTWLKGASLGWTFWSVWKVPSWVPWISWEKGNIFCPLWSNRLLAEGSSFLLTNGLSLMTLVLTMLAGRRSDMRTTGSPLGYEAGKPPLLLTSAWWEEDCYTDCLPGKSHSLGWTDGSLVKCAYCSCRGTKSGSQYPHWVAHKCL